MSRSERYLELVNELKARLNAIAQEEGEQLHEVNQLRQTALHDFTNRVSNDLACRFAEGLKDNEKSIRSHYDELRASAHAEFQNMAMSLVADYRI